MISAVLLLSLQAADSTGPSDTTRARQLPEVSVIGTSERLKRIPGSGALIGAERLRIARPRTLHDAVRYAPGVLARDEEGLGLRANIGLRGLNPTRSTTVLMLEDGIPFAIAPYGDNATYYTPPIHRFEVLEVLKGSSQIAYGPRTIGGVINLQTAAVPTAGPEGRLSLTAGTYGLFQARATIGTGRSDAGIYGDFVAQRGHSGRDNLGTTIFDGTLKGESRLSGSQSIRLKANVYRERSQVTYSGLREEEYASDPFHNPFASDSMFMDRASVVAEHQLLAGSTLITTRAYGSRLQRDWWRQSSNSAERPNDASDPACGGMANLATSCGNQGRLREYTIWGVEPRVLVGLDDVLRGLELAGGLRLHLERQERLQWNGDSPDAREAGSPGDVNAGAVEDNLRENQALAAFFQPRLELGRWTVTPGVRLEHVQYDRVNQLAEGSPAGNTSLTELIPGIGTTWNPSEAWTLFAGIHRGFAPPQTEDIITNTGGVVDLEAERSWNTELGTRGRLGNGIEGELTLFQLDFSNQVIPTSVAGGTGATLTSAGETLHRGMEATVRAGSEAIGLAPDRLAIDLAWTWVSVARFTSERYAWIGTDGGDVAGKVYQAQNAAGTRTQVSVEGNRLPYAPEHTVTAGLTWDHPATPWARLEMIGTGGMFADPVNTQQKIPDGQQGPIPGHVIWNLSAGYRVQPIHTTLSLGVKNLFDRRYLVDRTRGLMPGMPRMAQLGAEVSW